MECFVKVLSILVFDIGVEPAVEVRCTCFSDVLRIPFASRCFFKVFDSFFRGERLKLLFFDGKVREEVEYVT